MDYNNLENTLTNPTPAGGSTGPLIGTVIIIIVLVLGAIAVFYQQYQKSRSWQNENTDITVPLPLEADNSESAATMVTEPTWMTTSTSTNLDDIGEDLEAANFSSLEGELNLLETNLE